MSDDLAELLATERRKTRLLQAALVFVIALFACLSAVFVSREERQAAELRQQRDLAEQATARARAEQDAALAAESRARQEAEEAARAEARSTEIANLLKTAELKRKVDGFVNRKPPEPEVAPSPRPVER